MFRIRWASHHDFQRTRGVLRILASIAADLWQRQGSLKGTNGLIQTSDVNFENLDALAGQLKKLYGNGDDAVVYADVSGSSSNAFHIDSDIIQRIANKVNNMNIFNVLVAPSGEIPEQNKPALIILGPAYTANQQEIHKITGTLIKQIATKRGSSERIYRNTQLFLVSSEIGIAKYYEDLRNYCVFLQIFTIIKGRKRYKKARRKRDIFEPGNAG
jgi:hypothetical protein